MCSSLVLLKALVARLAAIVKTNVSQTIMAFVKGLAAGKMLTMICVAMLSEAAHLSDDI